MKKPLPSTPPTLLLHHQPASVPPPVPKKPLKPHRELSGDSCNGKSMEEKFSKSLDLKSSKDETSLRDELDQPNNLPSWTPTASVKEPAPDRDTPRGSAKSSSTVNLLLNDARLDINSLAPPRGMSSLISLSSLTQSTDSLQLLCSSPSLLSLQNSLSHAFSNPEQHSVEQLEELEKRRMLSIESLSKKVAERQLDLEAVCDELNSIDQIRVGVFKSLQGHDRLLSRLAIQIVQAERLVELETHLQLQLEKLESIKAHHYSTEPDDFMAIRRRRLAQQLEDALQLRASYDSRDRELDGELVQILPRDTLLEWHFYKTNMMKLSVERKQLEDKLKGVKSQLKCLEAVAPLPPQSYHSSQSSSMSTASSVSDSK